MKRRPLLATATTFLMVTPILIADEREVTPEQLEAVASGGDAPESEMPKRPDKLPDLTKGEVYDKEIAETWHLGPTGIVGNLIGRFPGDQVQILKTLPGSPAEGKFQWGDVITGINGQKFQAGGHLGQVIGKAIIEAEREANGGRITFQIWRDENYAARFGRQDVSNVDIDSLINETKTDDSLFEWKKEEERKTEIARGDLGKYPIKPVVMDVELTLRVLPEYSDTSPYDCPKTEQILADAWKVLERKFVADPKIPRSGRGGVLESIALLASGEEKHRKIVHEWVRSANCPWGPPKDPAGTMFEPGYKGYKGFQTWHHGFNGLNCALYYEATRDEYVLPALQKYAIDAALGQSGGGSWGHTFAYPAFNGGEFHRMNPGYGALNAAGNRCFFLIALAKHVGVEHPEIDAAIERACRFFGSYTDQGAIPYGDHGAAGTDDSNGKNTGVAFAMKLLGDKYKAKYFAQMSSHCAFTRRGGHAHDYHGTWSGWAASLCGPEIVTLTERNMRWRRTLCRLHDGSFVYHSPTNGKYKTLRDPTATEVLHYAQARKATLITGKDPDEDLWLTERDMKQMLASARPQFNDPMLIERDGTPWNERSTDEIFDLLDIFMPKARVAFAKELGKRYQAGEQAIAGRLEALLEHENPRSRHAALVGLQACGNDAVLSSLAKIVRCLDDEHEFVRISAGQIIAGISTEGTEHPELIAAMAKDPKAMAPNTMRNHLQKTLFAQDTPLANKPFDSGLDPDLVEKALEGTILLDPAGGGFLGSRIKIWDKETILRLAGPITFVAEQDQNNDQMFSNRHVPARDLLRKFDYLEAGECSTYLLRKLSELPRDIRGKVGFKDPMVDPLDIQTQPGEYTDLAGAFEKVLIDDPLLAISLKDERTKWQELKFRGQTLYDMIKTAQPVDKGASLAKEVRARYAGELNALKSGGEKIKHCRATLAQVDRMKRFEKIEAMETLVGLLDGDAVEDLLPFVGCDDWRLRDHSRKLVADLAKAGHTSSILASLQSAKSAEAKAGLVASLATAKAKQALDPVLALTKDPEPQVRREAIKAVGSIGGATSIPALIKILGATQDREDIRGCEAALDRLIEQGESVDRILDSLVSLMGDASGRKLESIHYLIGRIGNQESMAILSKVAQTKDPKEFESVVNGLSYARSREADQILIDLAASDKKRAALIGSAAVRRMAIGPKGYGDITNARRIEIADAVLPHSLDRGIIDYLGMIRDARAMKSLMFCLEKGVSAAAENLISCAEGLEKLPPADAKIAAQALRDVIEYIEVTRLRGGVKAHMDKDDNYALWKSLQARAGKALLKFHKPETAPIPTFDPLEFER